ncbi:hypothetical protein AVEN_31850-1 [Araneus ventricosus]|uniref:Uncharacterized protein n=1 Tax=Araneus ventricosus TaxID=182803 RepID=A0A4Y2F9H7_ARAVE|nr:hypothetical protein AVEN_31850-1 [Araneus ventricosus]
MFSGPTVFLKTKVTSFIIRSTACVCEGNLIKSQPSIGHRPVSSSEVHVNCTRCDITSLLVNEIYVVCSSKVNSSSNESANTISIFARFSIYEYVANALLDDISNFIFP